VDLGPTEMLNRELTVKQSRMGENIQAVTVQITRTWSDYNVT